MKKKFSIVLGMILFIMFAAYLSAGDTPASSAAELPGVRTLGSLSEKYAPVTFDHSKHVTIAGTCETCHHHANGNASLCKDCHGLSSADFKNSVVHSFMPCSNCHTALDRDNPAMPGLKVAYHEKCFGCHRGMGNLGLDPKGCTEVCHAKKV